VTVAYATSAELSAFLPAGTTVTDADRVLARASERIDGTVMAPFTVDTLTGLPSDPDIAAAMRDATCAQVEQWLEVGEENDIDGLAGTEVSVTGYSGRRAPRVAPRALQILQNAGLMTVQHGSLTDSCFGVPS
jgi:hypothetical protein